MNTLTDRIALIVSGTIPDTVKIRNNHYGSTYVLIYNTGRFSRLRIKLTERKIPYDFEVGYGFWWERIDIDLLDISKLRELIIAGYVGYCESTIKI